jgi:hypothetical protein
MLYTSLFLNDLKCTMLYFYVCMTGINPVLLAQECDGALNHLKPRMPYNVQQPAKYGWFFLIIHRVEVFSRSTIGWFYHQYGAGQSFFLTSLDIEIEVRQLYRRLSIPVVVKEVEEEYITE